MKSEKNNMFVSQSAIFLTNGHMLHGLAARNLPWIHIWFLLFLDPSVVELVMFAI